MMWWHGMPWGSMGWLGGLIMMFGGLLFVLLLAALVIWLVGAGRQAGGYARDRDTAAGRPSPLDIVRERYARGEITREEYERLRDDLKT